jgi:hypothetical protein
MGTIIESIGIAFERVLNAVDSAKKLLVLVTLFFLISSSYLVYRLSRSQELIASLIEPRIEYISGPCYFQSLRGGANSYKAVAIQFPLPDDLVKLGVTQSVSALLVRKDLSPTEFSNLCTKLVREILDPSVKSQLLKQSPDAKQWERRLQKFYRELEGLPSPTRLSPLSPVLKPLPAPSIP